MQVSNAQAGQGTGESDDYWRFVEELNSIASEFELAKKPIRDRLNGAVSKMVRKGFGRADDPADVVRERMKATTEFINKLISQLDLEFSYEGRLCQLRHKASGKEKRGVFEMRTHSLRGRQEFLGSCARWPEVQLVKVEPLELPKLGEQFDKAA